MMLSCRDLVKEVSSSRDGGWKKSLGIRFHLLMCKYCSNYVKQIHVLKLALLAAYNKKRAEADLSKIKDLEDKVIEKIK